MAHRLNDEAGVTRALAIGIRMTPAEIAKGRYMRAPDGHEAPASRSEQRDAVESFIENEFLGGEDDPEDEDTEGEEPEGDEDEGDEPEASDEDQDDADEAVKPIDPPVSWDKDAKEAFAQLPRELQATVAEREAQRDKAIQSATTEAANAKRNAVVEANSLFADQQRQYASELEQIARRLAPQAPDPALAAQDPAAYVQHLAYYQQQAAQHQDWMQQAAAAREDADKRDTITRQHELAQDEEILTAELGDDWTDMTRRRDLLTSLETVGAKLGYPMDLMGQANATDILALKAAAEWKDKADKYDKLQKDKMGIVRDAKNLPRVSKPGTSQTSAEKSARGRQSAWQQVKDTKGRSGDANAAYLESIGVKL